MSWRTLPGGADSGVPPVWAECLRGVDAVVHAAARTEFWGDVAGFRAHRRCGCVHRSAARPRGRRVKLAIEHALRSAASQGTTLVILRPPPVRGAGMDIAETAADAARGRFVWIDDGRHIADFVHVDNLADAVAHSLTRGFHVVSYYVTDGAP
ncbi:NAD-dependent epimerase/dehydratase family protein [Streptomyces sp. NPDC060184]|uniref:NAD-dependent epimerase/dehydratase family protein n=1 Tax=Streptomyces sp. NPDC060184 TaxID=3347064 RepID=UPI00364AA1AF